MKEFDLTMSDLGRYVRHLSHRYLENLKQTKKMMATCYITDVIKVTNWLQNIINIIPNNQCFGTDMVYYIYLFLKFNVNIYKTKVLLPQACVTLADLGYPL
jgi:hypothetical protein